MMPKKLKIIYDLAKVAGNIVVFNPKSYREYFIEGWQGNAIITKTAKEKDFLTGVIESLTNVYNDYDIKNYAKINNKLDWNWMILYKDGNNKYQVNICKDFDEAGFNKIKTIKNGESKILVYQQKK